MIDWNQNKPILWKVLWAISYSSGRKNTYYTIFPYYLHLQSEMEKAQTWRLEISWTFENCSLKNLNLLHNILKLKMPILFSAVAHEKTIISKFASCDGNFMEVIQQVISKIPLKDHKMTYIHGPYLIHNIVENQYLYVCITDKVNVNIRVFLC